MAFTRHGIRYTYDLLDKINNNKNGTFEGKS